MGFYGSYGKPDDHERQSVKQEKSFFETLTGALSPGWAVKLQSHLQPGQMDLGRFQVRLYLVDTSNGWTAAAAMAPEGFEEASRNVATAGLNLTAVLDAAGQAIAQLSRRQAGAGDAELQQGFQLVAAALTGTQTFKAVPPDRRAGHWLYLAYRGHDASTICRPVFFGSQEAGFCSPEVLTQMARQVIAHDLRPGTSVSDTLKMAGGAIIAPGYRV
jgi:hypothetical protein